MRVTTWHRLSEVERMEVQEKKFGRRILVVDDEARICEAVKRALERSGYRVDTS